MRPVSDAFLAALTGGHQMDSRARLVTTYQEGTDPDGTEIPVHGGDVHAQARADVRATAQVDTDGKGWIPRPSEDLTPYGTEVFMERGVKHSGGSTEWVSQGYFLLTNVDQDRVDGLLTLVAADRMHRIREGRLTRPRQFTAGTTVSSVFNDLVGDIYPSATIDIDADIAGAALGRDHVVERDRHGFLLSIATSRGKVMFFDYRGRLQVTSPPDPTTPVWTVSHGERGVLVEAARSLSRERVYNAVVAEGEGADQDTPVRAVVADANPDSPTYYFGQNSSGKTYGKVPRFYSSPLLTTEGQCRKAATTLLARVSGLPHAMDLTHVPNPALVPLDPVKVRVPGDTQIHVLDQIRLPWIAGSPARARTRETTLFVPGIEAEA